jgi:hypothetical protein
MIFIISEHAACACRAKVSKGWQGQKVNLRRIVAVVLVKNQPLEVHKDD